jgi:ComF family protein
MLHALRTALADLADLIYPNTCAVCNAIITTTTELVCIDCRLALPETNAHRGMADELTLRLAGRVPVRFVWAYLYYRKSGKTQQLVYQFKYKGKKEVAQTLGRWYGTELNRTATETPLGDLIVGVPLHPTRLRQRGYNQADWLANGLAEALQIEQREDVLIRKHFGGSQTKRSKTDRWGNVETAFGVARPELVQGRHLILVDDVLTTGATLEACAAELLRAGAASVGIITLAATQN